VSQPPARRPLRPEPPAVAIITPYYNTGALFEQTAAAVRGQTLQQWEWLIVNDGSTDPAALEVLEPLRGADPRIRVIDQPNRGLPAARNAGVAASAAPLLFFLDSDDLIAPTALEKLAWLLESDRHAAFATSWSGTFGAETFLWLRGFESRSLFLFENTATPLSMLRRGVFERVGGFEERRTGGLEDYELWLRCAAHGFWGRDLPEVLVYQRRKTAEQYPGYAWPSRDLPERFRAFQREMRARYPQVYRRGLPVLPRPAARPAGPPRLEPPFANLLEPAAGPRLLRIARGPAGLSASAPEGPAAWTLCALAPAPPAQTGALPDDTFVLPHMLAPADLPRFLVYLARSRAAEAALLEPDALEPALVAFLRAACPALLLLGRAGPPAPEPPPLDAWLSDGEPGPLAALLAEARAARAARPDRPADPTGAAADLVSALADGWTDTAPAPPGLIARRLAYERLALLAHPAVLRARQWRHQIARGPGGAALRRVWRRLRSLARQPAAPDGTYR
jgi:hypothetical protein